MQGTDPAIANPAIPRSAGAVVGGVSAVTTPPIPSSGVGDSVIRKKQAKAEKQRPSKRGLPPTHPRTLPLCFWPVREGVLPQMAHTEHIKTTRTCKYVYSVYKY